MQRKGSAVVGVVGFLIDFLTGTTILFIAKYIVSDQSLKQLTLFNLSTNLKHKHTQNGHCLVFMSTQDCNNNEFNLFN